MKKDHRLVYSPIQAGVRMRDYTENEILRCIDCTMKHRDVPKI